MSILPESIDRYRKFFVFIIKYANSDLVKNSSEFSNEITGASDQEEKAFGDKPQDLVEDLKNMGPVFIKLGQLLSTRPDLLPNEYLEALTSLQDDVEEVPYEEIEQIIEEEIGSRISKAFESFDKGPLANASLGQVHRATLRSGKDVAVKIQRPGIRLRVVKDLEVLQEMTDFATKHVNLVRKYDLSSLVEELRHTILQELDYVREARNLEILGENLKQFKEIIIPQAIKDYSTSRVLTMEYISGKKITSISPLAKVENDFSPLVEQLVHAYLHQIVVDGFAHADPHPGNVHLTDSYKVALMDLGMVAKFSPVMQENLLKLLVALSKKNGDTIANILLDISEYSADIDTSEFKKNVNRLVMDSQADLAQDLETGRTIIEMNRISAEAGLKIPVQLNLLGKILLNMDQIVATLAPNFNLSKSIDRYTDDILSEKTRQDLRPENFLNTLIESKRLAEHLPERLNKITENLANNKLKIHVEAIDEKRFTDGFQKVANRITLGLIIASMIIGAAMLMRIPTKFTLFGYPGLAITFFLLAAIAGLILAYAIVIKDEDFKKKI